VQAPVHHGKQPMYQPIASGQGAPTHPPLKVSCTTLASIVSMQQLLQHLHNCHYSISSCTATAQQLISSCTTVGHQLHISCIGILAPADAHQLYSYSKNCTSA
jgi:hypothetical protein